jgi:predicted SAM-dependent methyltransferase
MKLINSLKSRTPWQVKICLKLFLAKIPLSYFFWKRVGLFVHGAMDRIDYSIDVFHMHLTNANLENKLKGKTILELGPGDSVASAFLAKKYDAKSILVDVDFFANSNVDFYKRFAKQLVNVDDLHEIFGSYTNFSDMLSKLDTVYMCDGVGSLALIDSNKVDFIFSNSVLQHVKRNEFNQMLCQLYRILKMNGVCSHRVDFSDCISNSLNNLRFSDSVWESKQFRSSGFYTNRIRFTEILSLFESVGFKVKVTNVLKWREMPVKINFLNKKFSTLDENELMIRGADFLLIK